jgi:methenyltetrahydrofolate cyclohydrolase
MYDSSTTIHDFLQAAAARQPIPGGGSVTALVGALAASMGEMVLNYSIGKKNLAPHESELRSALSEFTRARVILLRLMQEDQAAYEAIAALRKLPPDSPQRQSQYAEMLNACIRVPEAVAATALAVLELCDRLADKVNVHLLSDLAVCAELSMATIRCGACNVRVNLPDLTDPAERKRFRQEAEGMVTRGAQVIRRLIPAIWQRAENP